jgi:hypothetical protein
MIMEEGEVVVTIDGYSLQRESGSQWVFSYRPLDDDSSLI